MFKSEKAELTVEIPAGVDDGMRVRIQGEGEFSPDGGPPGDCYCFISVAEHELFHREGSNLILAASRFPTAKRPSELKSRCQPWMGPKHYALNRERRTARVFHHSWQRVSWIHAVGGQAKSVDPSVHRSAQKIVEPSRKSCYASLAEHDRESVSAAPENLSRKSCRPVLIGDIPIANLF